MTIKAKANGLTFTFPDGTTQQEIEDTLDEYFSRGDGIIDTVVSDAGKGLLATAAKLADTPANVADSVLSAGSWVGNLVGIGDGTYMPTFKLEKAIPEGMRATGYVETAADVASTLAGGIGSSAALASRTAKLANSIGGRFGRWSGWAADNAIASAGGQLTSGNQLDTGTTAGDMTLGVALNALMPKVGRGLKALLRGNQEGQTLDAVQQINASLPDGVDFTPSRAMLTRGKPSALLEKHLENVLGSGYLFRNFNEANQKALNEFADVLRTNMQDGGGMSSEELGDAIRAGYQAFINAGRKDGEKYFAEAVNRAGVFPIRVAQSLDVLNSVEIVAIKNPAIADIILSPDWRRVSAAMRESIKPGLDLAGAIKLKAAIRNMMDDPGVGLKSTDDRELGLLAKALDEDILQALGQNKAPFGALGAYQEANRAWSAFQDELSAMGRMFADGASGDTLYARIFGKPSDALMISNADRVRGLLALMPEEAQKRIKAEMIYRAGRESAGQAGNEGRQFSAAAFLTNWTKLKDNGLADLLAGSHRADIDALAVISDRLKDLGKAVNYSNTANHLTVAGGLQGLGAFATGNVFAATPFILSNLTARALLNPEFAKLAWKIAGGAQRDSELARLLVRVAVLAEQDPDTAVDYEVIAGAIEGEN